MRAIVCGHRHWSLGYIGLLLAGCAGDMNGIDTTSIKPTHGDHERFRTGRPQGLPVPAGAKRVRSGRVHLPT